MSIKVIVVGCDAKDPFRQMGDQYLQRTHRMLKPELITVKESKRLSLKTDAKAKSQEAEALLLASANCFRIALDEHGKSLSSVEFATSLGQLITHSKNVAFLIGGASGLSENILAKCDTSWSLSPMTLPHRLAYCVLAEQIYRAGEILRNGPYHK